MRRSEAIAKLRSLEESIANEFNGNSGEFIPPMLAAGWLDQFEHVTRAMRCEDRRLFDDIPVRKRPTATDSFGEWGVTMGGGELWYKPGDIKVLLADVRQYLRRLDALHTRCERRIGVLLVLLGFGIYLTYYFGYIPLPVAKAVGIATVALTVAWGWRIALPLRTLVLFMIKKVFGL